MKAKIVLGMALALCLANAAGTASAQTPNVKIGVLTDMSGTYTDVSGKGSVLAAQMAIEDFGGKVLGNPITLVSADHQQKPDVAASIARQWFEKEGVDIILDLPNSGIALAVQNIAKEANRISVISSGLSDSATNKFCSPTGIHWTYDSYASGKMLAKMAKAGSTWFFLRQDSIGGLAMENSLMPFLKAAKAKVVGSVRIPLNTPDMSSFLLQAQQSGAQYIPIANAGADLINTMKQAHEFGLASTGQMMVGIVVFLTDLKAIGLENASGLTYATAFFPDESEEARAWSNRFQARHGAPPNDTQAGIYSATLHYLKAVQAANTKEARTVMAKMRELPVNDMFAKNGKLREDGRMVHDMYLVQAKKPSESTGPWDLLKLVEKVPGDVAFRPLSESECPLIKK
jgi:branched-chain amino acid transport system substrate-binding protein